MTATISTILDKAADLIEPRGAWTQGWYAKDADQDWTNPDSDAAVCWCMIGAVQRAAGNAPEGRALDLLAQAIGVPANLYLHDWNDVPSRRKGQVVAKLREAATIARERGL